MDGVSCAALLSHRSFADSAAIARALSFSLSDGPQPAAATTAPSAALFMHGAGAGAHPLPTAGGALPSPSPSSAARCRLGPAGRRAGKRRPRPSKRVPTTYISTDAATFRLMVQRVTGADEERLDADHLGLGLLMPPHMGVVGPCLLPPDHAPQAQAAPTAEQPLFPTLDSWNVMYGKNEVA